MLDFFSSYWWLLFPIGFFVFGAWDRWLAYQRSRDHLELLKTYTAQGKDPPPELVRGLGGDPLGDGPLGYDPYDRHSRRYYRRYWRYRYGYYWPWRGVFVTGALAVGFWIAADYTDFGPTEWPFRLVAIILGCVAAGNLVAAVFATFLRPK